MCGIRYNDGIRDIMTCAYTDEGVPPMRECRLPLCVQQLLPTHRNFVFIGGAGSGKSELAINFALSLLAQGGKPVHFFDLDMTKPLFRSRDQSRPLSEAGLRFHFEEQFYDAPTMAGGVSRLLRDEACYTVLDVGGDPIGARSIGAYAPVLNRPEAALYYVVNPYRPWSAATGDMDRTLAETLQASRLQPDRLRLVGNPNLGPRTTVQDILTGADALGSLAGGRHSIDFFCALESLAPQAAAALPDPVFPIRLYLSYPQAGL